MVKLFRYGLFIPLLLLALAFPEAASAQTVAPQKHDSIWNGVLIGAAIGIVAGMAVAPAVFCSHNDSECTAIVQTVIGLPAIGIGIGMGALTDHLHKQQTGMPTPFRSAKSVKVSFRF
jgi:hypothetical protein